MPMKLAPALAAMFILTPALAVAGSCPAESVLDTPREIERPKAKGVKLEVLENLSIAEWRDIGNYNIRMRLFEIAPGGVVARHSHADRPAMIYFISGEIFEHSTMCAVPILHKAGESTAEIGNVTHWWSNEGDTPVVLVSADIVAGK